MCVQEASDGTVTGDAFIAVEASGEYMNGSITDGKNSAESGHSVVSGTILVPLGKITAHIVIKDWVQFNPSSGQWEGQVEVQEQKVSGNVTLKFRFRHLP